MNATPRIPIKCMRCSGPISLQDNNSRHVPQTSEYTFEGPSNLVKTTLSTLNNDRLPLFPLLKLPLELREDVYRHVLSQDKQSLHQTRGSELDDQLENTFTAILATNHQVYFEARPFFLPGNAFLIRGTVHDHKWLKGLGPEGREQLRKVTFLDCSQSDPLRNYGCINILSVCPKLSLTIHIHCRQPVDLDQIGAFKHLHGFYRVSVENHRHGFQGRCPHIGGPGGGTYYVDMLLGQLNFPHVRKTAGCIKRGRRHATKPLRVLCLTTAARNAILPDIPSGSE